MVENKTVSGKIPKDRTTIRVLYFGLVRNVVKEAEETVTVRAGATVRELLEFLCQQPNNQQ